MFPEFEKYSIYPKSKGTVTSANTIPMRNKPANLPQTAPPPPAAPKHEKYRIAQFMNWFIRHYSTATIDGMMGYVDSMDREVTLKDILDDYYNQSN